MSDDCVESPRRWHDWWSNGDPAIADAFCELGPTEARQMVDAAGLGPAADVVPLESDENRVFRVDLADGERLVLKVFRHGRVTVDSLTEQAEVVALLAGADVPVAPGVALPDGRWVGEWEGQLFMVQRWLGTERPSWAEDAADFGALGAVIARMHEATAPLRLLHQPRYTPASWGRGSLEFLLEMGVVHASQREAFVAAAEELLDAAGSVWPDEPPVPIHADLGRWNVIWPGRSSPMVLDFEDLGLGAAWQDVYMLPHSLVNNRVCDQATADRVAGEVLEGYERVRPAPAGGRALSGVIEAMRGMHLDCWIAARRHDRHFGVRRLEFHTKRYWGSRVDRLRRYLEWVG